MRKMKMEAWVIQRQRQSWIDKDGGVLYCISSNVDRDIEKILQRFQIKEDGLPSNTKLYMKKHGIKVLNRLK